MASMTADLEYLRCDMCGTYLHTEIFCNHRRQCKGKDSVEIGAKEAAQLHSVLDKMEHSARTVCTQTQQQQNDNNANSSTNNSSTNTNQKNIGGGKSEADRKKTALRTAVANRWEAEEEAELQAKLNDDTMDALFAELNA